LRTFDAVALLAAFTLYGCNKSPALEQRIEVPPNVSGAATPLADEDGKCIAGCLTRRNALSLKEYKLCLRDHILSDEDCKVQYDLELSDHQRVCCG
jgi:hypothetical protein